jgi:5'-3' exonuclease
MSPRVLLVDASPYIFRAHFALPSSLVDREGRASNAVYGFGSFLLKLTSDEGPTHLAVAFDHSLTTSFRNEIYPEYKRQRELPPPDLVAQLDDCRALAHAFGAATFVDERYEADDLIGTLCAHLAGERLIVVTSDKDLAQLVGDRVQWLDYARQRRYGPGEVRERFGVGPRRIPDLLGLAGDPVDNIPGVQGVGPKTALTLLEHFESVEDLCARPERISELGLRGGARLRRMVEEQAEQALLSKRLATVARDAPAAAALDDLRLRSPRKPALAALFARLGFEALHGRILARSTGDVAG